MSPPVRAREATRGERDGRRPALGPGGLAGGRLNSGSARVRLLAVGCRLADGRAGEEGTGVVARWCVRLFSGCPRPRVRGPCSARGQASERVSRGRVLRLRDPAAQARPPPRLPSTFLNVLSVRGCALSFSPSLSPALPPLSGTLAVLTSRSLTHMRFFCFSSLIPARRCDFFLGRGRVPFGDDIG